MASRTYSSTLGWAVCLLTIVCSYGFHVTADPSSTTTGVPPSPEDLMVVDFTSSGSWDSATQMAVQTCAGLFNRNESIAGAAYTLMGRWDRSWLKEIEQIEDPTPYQVDKNDFLHRCMATVAKGRYIHYNYQSQQALVPVIITLAGVLDAVPLDGNNTYPLNGLTIVFDAEKEFSGFSPYDGTKYIFEHYANQTTTMAKLNPGYEFSKSGVDKFDPPLTGQPNLHLTDYIVKERLFAFFLIKGCIPMTEEHGLMEVMVQPRDDIHWPRPIAVFGYDEFSLGAGGDPFEAETDCVREHNLGQVATNDVNNLAYFSRKPPITQPLQQPPATQAKQIYNSSKTYMALVLGDGDNFVLMKERNYDWMQQRLTYCRNESMVNNCFPLSWTVSPHSLYAAPDLLIWHFLQAQSTGKDSFLLPPSGHLYAYPSTMQEDGAQKDFIQSTERDARLLNTSGTVDWEFAFTWGKAIHHYFPHFAEKENNTIQGVFAVDVPFNIPTFEFGKDEYYKVIRGSSKTNSADGISTSSGGGATILFRPREWRGTGTSDIPFSKEAYLSEKEMADEINGYPPGTVSYIYVTSDGGGNLDMLYNMVPFLAEHVTIVNHEAATDLALQRNSLIQSLTGDESSDGSLRIQPASSNGVISGASAEGSHNNKWNGSNLMIVDLLNPGIQSDIPTVLSILTCVGLFNRDESVAGAAYVLMGQNDLDWLRELEQIDDPDPYVLLIEDFLDRCMATVAKGRYINYDYAAQQYLFPIIVTMATVLDAVPLVKNTLKSKLLSRNTGSMVFDAEHEFKGFSTYDATKFAFERYANCTTAMAKLNPGYETSNYNKLHPPLIHNPNPHIIDFVVKERMFTFYLPAGCVPMTQEHDLMETMVQPKPDVPWGSPIAVFGYEQFNIAVGGDILEAETLCVKEHSLGQVASDFFSNLAFFSRQPRISTPLQQVAVPRVEHNVSKTYISLVIGDGDNLRMMKDRNYAWFQQRSKNCQNQSLANNCFPLSWSVSPHSMYAAPDMLRWFYQQGMKTGNDTFLIGPSGHLYAYPAMMPETSQRDFVKTTEQDAWLLNTSGTVDWEFVTTWGNAIRDYFPRYAFADNTVRGIFSVNVPFNAPTFHFGRHEFYKILRGGGATVVFRPREWRGNKPCPIPFSRASCLSEQEMASEINGYPPGTVTYLYITSDGGADLQMLYSLISFLGEHVELVTHEVLIDLALQRSTKITQRNSRKPCRLRSEGAFEDQVRTER